MRGSESAMERKVVTLVLLVAAAGCGAAPITSSSVTNGGTSGTGTAGSGAAGASGTDGSGGAAGSGGGAQGACSDLFDPNVLQTYAVELSADEWAKLDAEFHDVAAVQAGMPRETYHPVTFHFGTETVTNAAIRLKGQSSWVDTVMFDANPKMQFVIAFDQIDPNGKFHGLSKIRLDMPRGDWTFLNERMANSWLRKIGIMAPCGNSARMNVNGAYYGLYVAEESVSERLVNDFFPSSPWGDLFQGGEVAQTNKSTANWAKLQQLWAAKDIAAVQGIVDLPSSLLAWAAEAVLNDGDGYYGGSHNFYVYDQGATGYAWLPSDVDSTLGWIAVFTQLSWKQHPIFWWEGQPFPQPPGQHYLTVMNDPTWRGRYVDAIETQVAKWNPDEQLAALDAWAAQIAAPWPRIRISGRPPITSRQRSP